MTRFAFVLCAGVILASPALAQTTHFTPEQLDRMSAERQQELGPQNWGAPPPPVRGASGLLPVRPVPVPVRCASPARLYEALRAAPSLQAPQAGLAGQSIAVTAQTRNGWTRVLRSQDKYVWIPTSDVVPYRPAFEGAADKCDVKGVLESGAVAFDVHR